MMDAGSVIYRVLFGASLVLPLYEIMDIPSRSPMTLCEADCFMFMSVVLGVGGLVLVDIRDRLNTKKS